MANIGNNQVTAGVDGAVIGGVSIANTQAPLPTTIFGEDVVLDNAASALTIPQNYTFAIVGGIRANGVDASTGFLAADGAQIQVRDMPNRGFLNADFPLGFNGATVQYVNTTPQRVRWPENASSGALPFDGRNTTIIGQSVDVYSAASLSGLASNTADAFLFHLGAGDTGTAFDRTGTLLADDLQGHFNGVALDGVSFAGAITLQIPADVDYIGVTFPDYNKVVAPEINNARITAPKGGAARTMIKDGSLPFGTGLRAQDAAGRVVILIGDAGMFVPYQNPSSYGTTPTFTNTYAQIVTGGVNAGTAGSFWRGYGWKPRFLDVALGTEIEDGFIDLNLPSGHFAIQPSDNNQVVPPTIATDASGAISHSVDSNDNDGYWIITDSETPDQQNTTPNIDTAVVYTPVTPYYMSHLVEANVTPVHVPSGTTVESFDNTQTHDFQFSTDNLAGDRTFANANANTIGNSNATVAYAALKRANRDDQTGPLGEAIDTSTNGAGQVSFNGNLTFSGSLPTQITAAGNAAVRVGSGFVGGLNNGATHDKWSATNIILASGTTYGDIAFDANTNLTVIGATLQNSVTLAGNIIGFPNTFGGTIETGSTITVGPNETYNLDGATLEGTVTLASNEIGGTDVTIEGSFTGALVAGTGVNNIIIVIPSTTRVVTPNQTGRLFIERVSDGLDVVGTSVGLGVVGGVALPAIEFDGTGDTLTATDVVRIYYSPTDTAFIPIVYETTLAEVTAIVAARNSLLYASSTVTDGTGVGTPSAGSVAAGNNGLRVTFNNSYGVGDSQRALLLAQVTPEFFALLYRTNSGIGAGGTFISNFLNGSASGSSTYNSDFIQLSSDDTSVSVQRILTDVSPTGTEPGGTSSDFRTFIDGTQLFSVLYDRSNNATTGQIETIFRSAHDDVRENQDDIADKLADISLGIPVDNIITNP